MAFELGTYGSAVYAPLMGNPLPLPGEGVTWDWMDSVGLFSQRFRRIAHVNATVTHGNYATFNYEALRCDYFPPYLESLIYDSAAGKWHKYQDDSLFYGYWSWGCLQRYTQFIRVGVGTAFLYNFTGETRVFHMVAYL